MARTAAPIRLERAGIRDRAAFGLGERRFVRAGCARRSEESAVRLLRRMCEVTLEAVQQDRGPSVHDGKGITPQAQREPEPEVRAEERVRALARKVRRRARNADAHGVEPAVERDASQL